MADQLLRWIASLIFVFFFVAVEHSSLNAVDRRQQMTQRSHRQVGVAVSEGEATLTYNFLAIGGSSIAIILYIRVGTNTTKE